MRRITRFIGLGIAFGGTVACTSILGSFEVNPSDTPLTGDEAGTSNPDGSVTTDGGGGDDGATQCGFGQELRNGVCISVCQKGGNECSGHGTCVDSPTGYTCKCDDKYAGPKCGICATGQQDDDKDGTCNPTCATAALSCPPTAVCSTATGTATCVCPIGYAIDASTQCAWAGVIKDPPFKGVPANAWSVVSPGATTITFDTAGMAPGSSEQGYAFVAGDALCASNGRPALRQYFDMPGYKESAPMSLTITSSGSYPGGTGVYGLGIIGAAVGADLQEFPNWGQTATDTSQKSSMCLGEVIYGKGRYLQLAMYGSGCPGNAGSMKGYIDSVNIAPDQTCPAVGTVFNGDFEQGNNGWSPLANGLAAAYTDKTVGSNGSYGAVLESSQNVCDSASWEGKISVPLTTTTPNLALHFNYKGSGNGQSPTIRLQMSNGGGVVAANLVGNGGSMDPVSVCIPEWAKGHSGVISLDMPQATTCGVPAMDSRHFVFDDFSLTADAANCPAQSFIIDGDFERTAQGSPWFFNTNQGGGVTGKFASEMPANRYASITATRWCNDASVRQTISVPQIPAGQFYKVTFKYRTIETGAGGTFFAGLPSGNTPLASTGGAWANSGTVCINPNAGRLSTITFNAAVKGGANCGDTMTAQTLDIDNVVGAVVATCP